MHVHSDIITLPALVIVRESSRQTDLAADRLRRRSGGATSAAQLRGNPWLAVSYRSEQLHQKKELSEVYFRAKLLF